MAIVTEQTPKLLTADEFYEFVHRPENRGRFFELESGVIIEMPPPAELHGFVCGNAGRILGNFTFQRGRGHVCTNDTAVIIASDPDTVRGIDVTLYDDTMKFEELSPRYTNRLPILGVEVLSPDDRAAKTMRRAIQFLKRGMPLVWIVDPEDCDVTVYRAGREPYVLGKGDELTGDEVLPDFRCHVADLFKLPGE